MSKANLGVLCFYAVNIKLFLCRYSKVAIIISIKSEHILKPSFCTFLYLEIQDKFNRNTSF